MSYVVSLADWRPAPRYDGTVWQSARIEESAGPAGPWTGIDTFAVAPPDSDPERPDARSFTTARAVLPAGWYRLVWIDALGGEQITAPVAYPPADLTSLADVRDFLQANDIDTQQDAIISELISRASSVIMRWAGREFAPTIEAQTRTVTYRGGRMVDLGRWELRSATDVTVTDPGGTPVSLTPGTDYALRPDPGPDGVYQWLELAPSQARRFGRRYTGLLRPEVSITGAWGWPYVPNDVAHACVVTVATWLKRDVSAFARTFNLDEGRTERPDALPAAAAAILAPYRPVLVA